MLPTVVNNELEFIIEEELETIAAEEIRFAKEFESIIKEEIEVTAAEQLEIAWLYFNSCECSSKIEALQKELNIK